MAELSIVTPALGSRVGSDVDVVVSAAPGDTGNADFTLYLDGKPIGRDGAVGAGAVFTQLSLGAGKRLTVPLRALPKGRHELLLLYAADADAVRAEILRPFVVGDASSGHVPVAVGVVVVVLLGAAVVIRRRGLAQR